MDASLLFDPTSAGVVVLGTCMLAAVRTGWKGSANAISHSFALFRKPFDMVRSRAEIAHHIARMRADGVIRSEPATTADPEIADATAALVKFRSTEALIAEHDRHVDMRRKARNEAIVGLNQAGELAPIMGLTGTLLALSQLPLSDLGQESALLTSVSQAVLSTLYGLIVAHLLFFPLAAAIERRGRIDDDQRDRLVDWLVKQLEPACPSAIALIDRDAA